MSSLNLTLPDSVTESEARLLLAIKLFEEERVSCGKAAQIAGYSKRTFMELLGRHGVAVFNESAEALASDLRNA